MASSIRLDVPSTWQGLVFTAFPVGIALAAASSARLIVRMGTRRAVFVGLVGSAVLTGLFGLVPDMVQYSPVLHEVGPVSLQNCSATHTLDFPPSWSVYWTVEAAGAADGSSDGGMMHLRLAPLAQQQQQQQHVDKCLSAVTAKPPFVDANVDVVQCNRSSTLQQFTWVPIGSGDGGNRGNLLPAGASSDAVFESLDERKPGNTTRGGGGGGAAARTTGRLVLNAPLALLLGLHIVAAEEQDGAYTGGSIGKNTSGSTMVGRYCVVADQTKEGATLKLAKCDLQSMLQRFTTKQASKQGRAKFGVAGKWRAIQLTSVPKLCVFYVPVELAAKKHGLPTEAARWLFMLFYAANGFIGGIAETGQ